MRIFFFKLIVTSFLLFCFSACIDNKNQNVPLNLAYFNNEVFYSDPVSPSLLKGPHSKSEDFTGKILIKDQTKGLTIETALFICSIEKDPFDFSFINKSTQD